METTLYTVHHKSGQELEVISDGFDFFALVAPLIWAVWHGLWIVMTLLTFVMALSWFYSPLAPMLVMYAIGFVFAFESGAVRRFELALKGWRVRGVVQAASPEGAEEQFLNGHAV